MAQAIDLSKLTTVHAPVAAPILMNDAVLREQLGVTRLEAELKEHTARTKQSIEDIWAYLYDNAQGSGQAQEAPELFPIDDYVSLCTRWSQALHKAELLTWTELARLQEPDELAKALMERVPELADSWEQARQAAASLIKLAQRVVEQSAKEAETSTKRDTAKRTPRGGRSAT